MPTLSIAEFAGHAPSGAAPAPMLPPLAEQVVDFATIATSAEFYGGVTLIRLVADAACAVAVGESPELRPTSMRLAANIPEFFSVTSGHKLTVAEIGGAAPAAQSARRKPKRKRR